MFVIPNECKPYMEMQVVQYRDDPLGPAQLALQEACCYLPFLPKEVPDRVLDFGCGLGRAAVMLHIIYGRPGKTLYIMADADRVDDPLIGGWQPSQREWCNSLERTYEFMLANGIAAEQVSPCDILCFPAAMWNKPPMDLVISTLAVGFHWPIEDYLFKPLAPLCREGTVLIFGVRHGKYSSQTAFAGFDTLGYAVSGGKQDFLAIRKT